LTRYQAVHPDDNPGQLMERAIAEHRAEVVLGLLEHGGVEINAPCVPERPDSVSPFMTALRACDARIASLIAGHGGFELSASLTTHATWTFAASCPAGVVEGYLALPGTNANHADGNGETLLHQAVRSAGAIDTVRALLARPGIAADAVDGSAMSPLHVAAVAGNDAAVALLLAVPGVDVNNRNRHSGWTVLMDAVFAGHTTIVERLLAHDGVDAGIVDGFGATALHIAAQRGATEAARLLIGRSDVKLNRKDHLGRTPLSLAAFHGHLGVVEALLARPDVDVNLVDRDRQSPLWWAVAGKREAVVRRLMREPRTLLSISNRPAHQTAHGAAVELGLTELAAELASVPPRAGDADRLSPADDYVERTYEPPPVELIRPEDLP
jgi:ankyrin repeat protein